MYRLNIYSRRIIEAFENKYLCRKYMSDIMNIQPFKRNIHDVLAKDKQGCH